MSNNEIKMINAPITLWEAAMIRKLRKYKYGKVTVHIQGGNPVFLSIKESKKIIKEEGLNLEGSVAIDPLLPSSL